jgi:hypothetical protein
MPREAVVATDNCSQSAETPIVFSSASMGYQKFGRSDMQIFVCMHLFAIQIGIHCLAKIS